MNPTLEEILKDFAYSQKLGAMDVALQAISAAMDSIIGNGCEWCEYTGHNTIYDSGDKDAMTEKEPCEYCYEVQAEARKRKDTFLGGGNG